MQNNKSTAKIKDVYIELDDYKFFHTPYNSNSEDKMESRFVGRVKIKDRIKTLLNEAISNSGTYLITGFRGMGKTSVLRQAIAEVNEGITSEKNRKFKRVEEYKNRTFSGLIKRVAWLGFILLIFDYLFLSEHNSYTSDIFLFFEEGNSDVDLTPFILLYVYGVFIVSYILHSFLRRNSEEDSKRFSSALDKPNYMAFWSFTKLISFLLIAGIITLYFIYPKQFCDKNLFGFYCLKNRFASIPIQIAESTKYFSLIIGVLVSYVIVTLVLFIHDTLYRFRFNKSREVNKNKKSDYVCFEINLSQDTISDREVLKRINDKILEFWRDKEDIFNTHQFQRRIYWPLLLLVKLISTGKKTDVSKYHSILAKLEGLQKRLEGNVSRSEELGSNPNYAATFVGKEMAEFSMPVGKVSDRNTVNYSLATAKEAEDELITIFNEIENSDIPKESLGRFVFIIDELDKIEPQSNSLIDEREFSNPAMDGNLNLPGSREYRKRQEAVAKLLANLKGFLNAANAKFFFIGGRELFDADLADIADRDSFYSSIFNDVIYVESFYKDNPEGGVARGISGLTESFFIKLIDKEAKEGKCRLKDLFIKVKKSKNGKYFHLVEHSDKDKKGLNSEEFKLFSVLQNYIIYLTYRGTGTPKKLTALVESLIISKTYDSIIDDSIVLTQSIITNKEESRLFLKFSYTAQYEINLTTDILRPYLITNSRFLTNLGDKLLFSTPFIFDHIIKFYPYGFAWRNLELIPEVVLVNKEPYLRDHIKSILKYLSNYHIKQAVSGLYDYKFHSIVRKELSILTKRSDLAAAAFNFTLDESLLVKRHYKKKLIELRDKYKGFQPLEGDNQFVHSLSFVQTILGDLYFYDKEYDEAILYYTESIQTLRLPNAIDNKYLTRHQYLIWLRNKLKIGLTLEKIEAYDSAISLYRTLMIDTERYLLKIVNSDSSPYTKEESKLLSSGWEKTTKTIVDKENIDLRSEDHRNMHLITLPFVAQLTAIEKLKTDGITYSNLYQNKEELKKVLDPYKSNVIEKSEGRLYLKKDDYRKGWLWADYFSNVGSILFYKNCQFTRFFTPNAWVRQEGSFYKGGKDREFIESEYKQDEKFSKIFDENFFIKEDFPKLFQQLQKQYNKETKQNNRDGDFFPSLTSICYYWEALNELTTYQSSRIDLALRNYLICTTEKNKFNPLQYCSFYLLPEFVDMISARRFYYLGNIVSKIGDAILASLNKLNRGSSGFQDIYHYYVFKYGIDENKQNITSFHDKIISKLIIGNNFFSIENVLSIYCIANELFRRSNQNYYYTFGQRKVLTVIKEIVDSMPKQERNTNYHCITMISEEICLKIIKSTSWYNSISNRAQIKKYRDIFNLSGIKDSSINSLLYTNTSNNSDVLESILLTETIKMRSNKDKKKLEKYIKLKQTDAVRTKYIRLMQLKYHIEQQYNLVVNLKGKEIFNSVTDLSSGDERNTVEHYVLEAFFALRESIKIIQMYTPGYIIGHSYLATAHMWSGHWCQLYEKNLKYIDNDSSKGKNKTLYKKLKNLLGQSSTYFLESNYQYEMAIQSYYNVLQIHSEGLAYKNKICDFYILEDDYNDTLAHFNLAIERYQVNTNQIRNRINDLSEIVGDSRLYKYYNYSSQDNRL